MNKNNKHVCYILTYENTNGDLLTRQVMGSCIRNAVSACTENILEEYKNENYILIDIKIASNNTITDVDLEDWNESDSRCG